MKYILNLPKNTVRFLREVVAELRAVKWISRRMVAEYTLAVISITVLTVATIASMDALLVAIRSNIL